MKVIKKGFEHATIGKELTCVGDGFGKGKGGCGAVLHVVPADIYVKHFSIGDYDGTHYWFVCPECSAKTYVKYDVFHK
ncbi:MAG: hypothetical protein A2563_05430 [Candidatus Magasanikbacteria bacterium RIFOXYD1_FULL_40_23]|uniref:Uncharacterized protein n=1 Tax=Candidatus Magasanikbacteria bacterium RIFOXYD1_FULL_40_23 TaxID=1798705 RepID=A0A1F6PA28_9BACT|nr:MAG: hypothetical protein A2563_05430 [Candidatus Magasanikbacteria bacterium RIFOXYD1_FULL_40_23]